MVAKEFDESIAYSRIDRACRRCVDIPKSIAKITAAILFVALLVTPYLSAELRGRVFSTGYFQDAVAQFRSDPEPAEVHQTPLSSSLPKDLDENVSHAVHSSDAQLPDASLQKDRDENLSHTVHNVEAQLPDASLQKDRDVNASHTVHNVEAQRPDASYMDANKINSETQRGQTHDFNPISNPMSWTENDSGEWRGSQKRREPDGGIPQSPEDKETREDPQAASGDAARDQSTVMEEVRSRNRSLEELLEAAALPSKTVIITSLNAAWAENNTMIDIFLEGFRKGNDTERLLKNLIIVAFDQRAFDRCIRIHEYCLKIETPGVDFSQEKLINSEDFLKMMWRRVQFLGTVLEKGYNFIFTDADILWLRDPFPHFKALKLEQVDMAVASDHFNGNTSDAVGNAANTGFIYARATDRTSKAYRSWYDARERYPRKKEQDVFNAIKLQRRFRAIGLRLRVLDNQNFAAFCGIGNSDMAKVVTMHGACCRGLKAKLFDLRTVLDSWNLYLAHPPTDPAIPSLRFKRPWACPRSWPRRPKT